MGLQERYRERKNKLLSDTTICEYNRQLFRKFFSFEEQKLKRLNALTELDEASYKTLVKYLFMFRNVNFWFDNRPWNSLSKKDIRRVYDGLEDHNLKTLWGRTVKCRSDYYNRVFKSKPFRLAGKSELAKDVIEYYRSEKTEVRCVEEDTFLDIASVVSNPSHLLLLWLGWDFGENINALLQLKKSDFRRETNPLTNEPEYQLRFRREILKRSRKQRTIRNLYRETVRFLDMVLKDLEDNECVFKFEYRQALQFFKGAAKRCGARCWPDGAIPSWKHLRSGMACHLLKNGWSVDEIKARLGHSPSSEVIDRYVSLLVIDDHESKQKLYRNEPLPLRHQLLATVPPPVTNARAHQENQPSRSEVQELKNQVQALQAIVSEFLKSQTSYTQRH